MPTQVSKIDKQGRIQLPEKMREESGLLPETDVLIEVKDDRIFIKPKLSATPVTQRIAEMGLSVSDWEEMEEEINELQRLNIFENDLTSTWGQKIKTTKNDAKIRLGADNNASKIAQFG